MLVVFTNQWSATFVCEYQLEENENVGCIH